MYRHLLTLLLLLALTATVHAQDPVFSQFYTAPLRLNPGFAGIGSAPRVALNYRAQHTSYPSAFTTFSLSYEQPIERTPSSFGFRVLTDRQLEGAYKNTDAAVVYSYDVQFTKEFHARLGISAGLLSTSLDFGSLIFGDVLDPIAGAGGGDVTAETIARANKISADFGAGVVLYGQNLYFGAAVDHLNRPDENLLELGENLYTGRPQRFTLTGGAQLNVKRYSNRRRPAYVTPNFLYASQGRFRQLNLGAYLGYGPVAVGGWYRHAFENADGFIAAISARKDVFRVGFSYDAVVSALRTVPGGLGATYEVSMTLDFGDSKKLQRKRFSERYQDCFGMFR